MRRTKGTLQSDRLTNQHKESHGVEGIFDTDAKKLDKKVGTTAETTLIKLQEIYPALEFRIRPTISKIEINEALQKIDRELGQTLFVSNASIKPDGGIIEVKDDNDDWRIVVISEEKFQG